MHNIKHHVKQKDQPTSCHMHSQNYKKSIWLPIFVYYTSMISFSNIYLLLDCMHVMNLCNFQKYNDRILINPNYALHFTKNHVWSLIFSYTIFYVSYVVRTINTSSGSSFHHWFGVKACSRSDIILLRFAMNYSEI